MTDEQPISVVHVPDEQPESLQPAVGLWAMTCCERDLHQIETEEEVADILEWWDEDDDSGDWPILRVFPTREGAWDVIFPYIIVGDPFPYIIVGDPDIKVHRPLTLADIAT